MGALINRTMDGLLKKGLARSKIGFRTKFPNNALNASEIRITMLSFLVFLNIKKIKAIEIQISPLSLSIVMKGKNISPNADLKLF